MVLIDHVARSLEPPQAYSDSPLLVETPQAIQNAEACQPCYLPTPSGRSGASFPMHDDIDRQPMHGSAEELGSLFGSHQFAGVGEFAKDHHHPHVPADDIALDAHFQLDPDYSLPSTSFGSVTNHQPSNFASDDFAAADLQLLEMYGMHQMGNVPPPSALDHVGSSLTSYNGASAPRSVPGGSQKFLCNPQSYPMYPIPGSSSGCKQDGEFASFFHRQPLDREFMLAYHDGPVSQSSLLVNSTSSLADETAGGVSCALSGFNGSSEFPSGRSGKMPARLVDSHVAYPLNSVSPCHDLNENCTLDSGGTGLFTDAEFFDSIELNFKDCNLAQRSWDDIIISEEGNSSCPNSGMDILGTIPEFNKVVGGHPGEFFSHPGQGHPVDAVSGYTNGNTINSVLNYHTGSLDSSIMTNMASRTASYGTEILSSEFPSLNRNGSLMLPEYNFQKLIQGTSSSKSQLSSWIDDCNSMNLESSVTTQRKKSDETTKVVKKRARPGESTRPRPKDRQLIQDRVKELREIVPNSTKCSIDALLDRTIKHMLYLQSVTKYADKLKQTDEPKIIGEESGVVLRDSSSGNSGGTTWAFEVAGQTMVCPIIVEDLSPPGQMLIEMLCEERGLFLEIADVIRGFGLTILKGVMEVRNSKIWSRFLVEASGNVTRMDIFLSLVQLLQQTNNNLTCQPTKDVDQGIATLSSYRQARLPYSIGSGGNLQ